MSKFYGWVIDVKSDLWKRVNMFLFRLNITGKNILDNNGFFTTTVSVCVYVCKYVQLTGILYRLETG